MGMSDANTTVDYSALTVAQANTQKLTDLQTICNSVASMVALIGASEILYFPALPLEYATMTTACITACNTLCAAAGLGSYLQATGQAPATAALITPPPTATTNTAVMANSGSANSNVSTLSYTANS